MTTGALILIIIIGLFYFVYTLSFALYFFKADKFFDKRQRRIHRTIIWLVPFIWIMILKTIARPVSGKTSKKSKAKKKAIKTAGVPEDPDWTFACYSFFHGRFEGASDRFESHADHGYYHHTGDHHDFGGVDTTDATTD